nr:hypothetical protein Iba_chr14dCG0140 [Ipomoea batatas]
MLCVGSSAILLLSSEAVSFYGKKGTLLLQRRRRQMQRFLIFWNCIEGYMKNTWLFLSPRGRKVSLRSLRVDSIQQLLRLLFQTRVVVYKVQLHTA